MKFLVVVDMQNDFVTGSLKNEAAQKIIPYIKKVIEKERKAGTKIIYTYDTHDEDYMNTLEGKKLPVPHCCYNTEGWEVVAELKPSGTSIWTIEMDMDTWRKKSGIDLKIMKSHFGYDNWKEIIPEGSEVLICGVVTSICVAANASALKMIEGVEVSVLTKGCADLSEETQDATFKVLASQQCNILR